MDGSSPLRGVRVLELGDASGGFAARLLAMFGADVATAVAEPACADWAAGKRAAAGADLPRLAGLADVVIDGAPRAAAPHVVAGSISSFGDDGPRAAWRASELVAQATGGMLGASGLAHGPPLAAPALQARQQAGIFGAIGIVAALLARERSGRGQRVEVSMQAAVAASLEHVVARFLHDGTRTARTGRLHWTRCFQAVRARDGWVAATTLGDWTTLVEWLASDGMAADLRDLTYADPGTRTARAEHVFDVLETWSRGRDAEALAADAQLRRLAMAAVRLPAALRDDPQLAARGFFDAGRDTLPGPPFRLGRLPRHFARLPDPAADPVAVAGDWAPRPAAPVTPSHEGTDPQGPLAALRIADFTWLVAGPTATRVLADLGADVVKIEHPDTPDAGDRRGGFTGSLNRGKQSVVLDLTTERDRATARGIALAADVVIDNFSARVMEQLGLDPGALRAAKPDLICVRMTGFGLDGPDRDQVSFGPTLQARTGFTALMADRDGSPIGAGFSYADVASGHLAALAVILAVFRRRRTGCGATVDFSQLEAMAALMGPAFCPRSDTAAPEGVYPCADDDRWIALTVDGEDDWQRFAAVLGRPAWTREARFATADARAHHRPALDATVADWTRTQDAAAAVAVLQGAGIAAGVVADATDLCERDPQLAAWGFVEAVATPEGATVRLQGPPFRLSDTPVRIAGPGPLVGEHTAAVSSRCAPPALPARRASR
jgi:crotonobetainyl-CoA:carnitine CoA-transferase CaiB-like acyl-CoA transferase